MDRYIPTPEKPAFGIIAPTQYLEELSVQSKFHLVLAHLLDSDPEYLRFYQERSEQGDYIIMDNGAFELGESYAPEKLIDLAKRVGADRVVLPDYPFQPAQTTIMAAVNWGQKVKDAGFDTLFIPQSEVGDITGWTASYLWASVSEVVDGIGISILAAPSALPHIHDAYARVCLMQILKQLDILSDKYHHCFGAIDVALEIPSLLSFGVVNSIDSSNPVWYGLNGHRYNTAGNSYVGTRKQYIPHVDFNFPYNNKLVDFAQENVDIVLDMFN